MHVVKMIPYNNAEEIVEKHGETIGGLGGFFQRGMRWRDYLEAFTEDVAEYAEAFRAYVIEHGIKRGGDWHQHDNTEGAPLFSDGKAATFSYRAWGDIMAAIWAEQEDADYDYMDFYMDATIPVGIIGCHHCGRKHAPGYCVVTGKYTNDGTAPEIEYGDDDADHDFGGGPPHA